MIKMIRHFPGLPVLFLQVLKIFLMNSTERSLEMQPVMLVKDKTYEILHIAEAALVTSGTATLEAALLGTPQVVCYKGDFFSMLIAWMVVKVKYISLVNLIMGIEVIKELVQYDLKEKNLMSRTESYSAGRR